MGAFCGCASIADYHYSCVTSLRARSAWADAKKCLPKECITHDFAKGYQAGFVEVSKGGNECLPPVPPNCYWGPHYQTPEGLCKVQCWYSGYSLGARQAAESCRHQWHNLPSLDNVSNPCLGDQCVASPIGGASQESELQQCFGSCHDPAVCQPQ
jgi:hypothetical protein